MGGIRGDFIPAVEFNTHEKERGMRRSRGREREREEAEEEEEEK